jgi:hypothetical protein
VVEINGLVFGGSNNTHMAHINAFNFPFLCVIHFNFMISNPGRYCCNEIELILCHILKKLNLHSSCDRQSYV